MFEKDEALHLGHIVMANVDMRKLVNINAVSNCYGVWFALNPTPRLPVNDIY